MVSLNGVARRINAVRFWKWFWRPATRFAWGAILLLGGIASLAAFGTVTFALEQTNRTVFCISCHEMERVVYEEYKKTRHFKNASGVSVACSDCHVPKEIGPKLLRKFLAVKDIYGHLVGNIDTPEKFESERLEMARTVWAYLKDSDSRECRSCHSFTAMDFELQERRPREKHPEAMQDGNTCIDCHKGIAHDLPRDWDADDDND